MSNLNNIFKALLLAALVAGAGCASAAPGATKATPHKAYNDCIFGRSLTDWRPLDRENLILFGAGRQAYHVVLAIPAMQLNFSVAIGVYDRDGRICPYGGDSIIVDGAMPERILIRSIQRLTDAELDELYVQYGIKTPKIMKETTLAPEPAEDSSDK